MLVDQLVYGDGHMSTNQWRRPRVRGSRRYWTWLIYASVRSFGLDEAAKRILDMVAAIIGIILFAPILLIIPILINLRLPQIG